MTKIIAHRGLRDEIPENTIESIKAAIDLFGIYGVEFDVQLANLPVVLHQETMFPNATFTALQAATRDYTSRDWVGEHSAESIVKLDAGSWKDPKFSKMMVPYLSDVLNLDWGETTAFMELIDTTYWGDRDLERPQKVVNAVTSLIQEFEGKLEIISFNPKIIAEVKKRFPNISTVLALWLEWQEDPKKALEAAIKNGANSISLADQMVLERPNWIREIQSEGLEAHVFPVSPTIGEPEYKNWTAECRQATWNKLLDLGVDAIITDFSRSLIERLQ